jgi:hypothetical protein
MPASLDEFRTKLISKIIDAVTLAEVNDLIDTAMAELEKKAVNGHIVVRFADKIIDELEKFRPVKNEPRQWSNISIARVLFSRIKMKMRTPAH